MYYNYYYTLFIVSQGRVHAAHLCYHLAGLQLGTDSDTQHKYSLLGVMMNRYNTSMYTYIMAVPKFSKPMLLFLN